MVPEHPHLSAPPWALLTSVQVVLVPGPYLLTHMALLQGHKKKIAAAIDLASWEVSQLPSFI